MRKLYIVVLLALLGIFSNRAFGQCQGGFAYDGNTYNPTTTWQSINDIFGGEYIRFNVVAGTVYEFSFCSSDGGAISFDTEISMNDNLGIYIGSYNDDAVGCGNASRLTWTAPSTGVFRVVVTEFGCVSNSLFGTNMVYRQLPCTTPAVGGTAVASRLNIISNDSVRFTVSGHTGIIDWEYYFDNPPWISSGTSITNPNFFITDATGGTLFVRARLVNGGCVAYSNTIQVVVGCATAFDDPCNVSSRYISNVTFNTINNNSTFNSNTAYQNFTNQSTTVCKTSTYNLSISSVGGSQGRAAWIDYNNDGDFDDPGENVMPPTAPSTLPSTINVTIPGTATSAAVRMRVVSVDGIAPNALSCFNTVYTAGEFEEYTINISDIATSTAGANQTICTNTAIMAGNAPGSGTGVWSVVAGSGTFSNSNLNTTNVVSIGQGTNTYRWTVTTACGTATSNVVVQNNSPTTANAGPNITVCVATANMAGNTPTIGSGSWSLVSGSGVFTTPSSPTSNVTGIGIGVNQYMWTTTNSGCTSTSVVTVSYGPPSTSVAGAAQTICSPNTTLSGNTPTLGTGSWSVVSGGGLFFDMNDPSTQVTAIGPGNNTFRWTITNICGSSTSDVVIANDGPTPAQAGANQTICNTDSTIMAGNAPSVGTGVWMLMSGTGTINDPTNPTTAINGLGLGANVFRWTTTRLSCTSTSEVTLTVVNSSIISNAGPNQNICGTNATLAGSSPSPGTGLWSVVNGSATFNTASNPTTTVSGLSPGLNTLRWTVTEGGCSDFDDMTIDVEVFPVVSAGSPQNICVQNAIMAGSSPGSGTGVWSVTSGTGAFGDASDPAATVSGLAVGPNVLRWTVTNSCGTGFDETTITIGQYLPVYSAGPNQSVCSDTAILNASNPGLGTSIWAVSSGNAVFSSLSNPTATVTQLNPGVNKLVWTVFYGICVASDTVDIEYLQPATIANAGVNQQVCDSTAQLGGNVPVVGSGFWMVISGAANVLNPTSATSLVSGIGTGNNVFRWYITNGSCYSSFDEVTIFRGTPPTQANAGQDIITCRSIETLSGNAPQIGSGMWTVATGNVTLVNPQQGGAQVLNITPGDSIVLVWTINNAGCTSKDSMRIRTLLPATANFNYTVSGVNVNFTNASTQASAYEWSFGDGNFSTQANPSHTYIALGTFNVRLVAFNPCKNDTMFQVVNISLTDVEDHAQELSLNLYPNPAETKVYFNLPSGVKMPEMVQIISSIGQVFEMPVHNLQGLSTIDVSTMSPGAYILRMQADAKVYYGKFIRQ
jgi:hypothetical protein